MTCILEAELCDACVDSEPAWKIQMRIFRRHRGGCEAAEPGRACRKPHGNLPIRNWSTEFRGNHGRRQIFLMWEQLLTE
jgi:hypothetical protein